MQPSRHDSPVQQKDLEKDAPRMLTFKVPFINRMTGPVIFLPVIFVIPRPYCQKKHESQVSNRWDSGNLTEIIEALDIILQRLGVTTLPRFRALVRFAHDNSGHRSEPHRTNCGSFHPSLRFIESLMALAERRHTRVLDFLHCMDSAAATAAEAFFLILLLFIRLLTKSPPLQLQAE
eukprot:IDg4281t1